VHPRTDEQPWQDFDLVQRAAAYAAEAHRGDLRKGKTVPYLSHLWAVAALVLEHGGDDEQVAAALLHDVVEDHGGLERLADLRAEFGDEVARLVKALSDSVVDTTAGEEKAPWSKRKGDYLAHLATTDDRVRLISACDKLDNARGLLADVRAEGPATFQRFNAKEPADQLWYYRSLADILTAGDLPTRLADDLRRTVDALAQEAGVGGLPSPSA
jgi:(p)ppGpp synthase/HD superfamily hydrolase